MSQIENMVMQKTDYSIPDSMGILMTFKYDNVNLMDFQRIDELHDIGYNRTISMMDSIKSRIHRRVNLDNIRLRRMDTGVIFRSYALKISSSTELIHNNKYILKENFINQITKNSLMRI